MCRTVATRIVPSLPCFAALVATVALLAAPPARAQTPEGFGENATGGAGKPIVHVTNLMDNDPNQSVIAGSMRAAVHGSNRIIVFDVGGTITLKQKLDMRSESNVTIDGTTAPPPGITLRLDQFEIRDSHNIIVRNLRLRVPRTRTTSPPASSSSRTARTSGSIICPRAVSATNRSASSEAPPRRGPRWTSR